MHRVFNPSIFYLRCIADHWHIASGEGCEPCNCDPVGSKNMTCNEYTGQCECKDEFGGRACDQCKENHWGDPKIGDCKPCDCNPEGSKSFQCDWTTGKCECLEGQYSFDGQTKYEESFNFVISFKDMNSCNKWKTNFI